MIWDKLPGGGLITKEIALSIRQPWAWLISNGLKHIENRTRRSHYRGPLLIHAGQRMTVDDYQSCSLFLSAFFPDRRFTLPPYLSLRKTCGGIVGQVTMTHCVTESLSPWFTGDFGYVFNNPRTIDFQPCKGRLGFFKPTIQSK